MTDILELSELLMAKLCHDLAGPIGAINNGVELLKDPNPTLHEESVELIEISAKEAVARLLYFRMAYGVSQNSAGVSMTTVKDLVRNFYNNKNITFTWPESHGDSDSMQLIKTDMAKLILNIILIISGTLVHGGSITIKIKNLKNDLGVKVRGESKAIRFHEYILKSLTADFKESEIDSKNVQAYLTTVLAKRIGGKIKTDFSDNYIEIVAS